MIKRAIRIEFGLSQITVSKKRLPISFYRFLNDTASQSELFHTLSNDAPNDLIFLPSLCELTTNSKNKKQILVLNPQVLSQIKILFQQNNKTIHEIYLGQFDPWRKIIRVVTHPRFGFIVISLITLITHQTIKHQITHYETERRKLQNNITAISDKIIVLQTSHPKTNPQTQSILNCLEKINSLSLILTRICIRNDAIQLEGYISTENKAVLIQESTQLAKEEQWQTLSCDQIETEGGYYYVQYQFKKNNPL